MSVGAGAPLGPQTGVAAWTGLGHCPRGGACAPHQTFPRVVGGDAERGGSAVWGTRSSGFAHGLEGGEERRWGGRVDPR